MYYQGPLEDCFALIKKSLSDHDFIVNPYRELNGYVRFMVFLSQDNGLLRLRPTQKEEDEKETEINLDGIRSSRFRKHIEKILLTLPGISINKARTEELVPDEEPDAMIGVCSEGVHDYFGPIVTAAVFVDTEKREALLDLPISEAATLTGSRLMTCAERIQEHCPHSMVVMSSKGYNDLFEKTGNRKHILAWSQSRVIETTQAQEAGDWAISNDKNLDVLVRAALMNKGKRVSFYTKSDPHQHPAWLAAKILARATFQSKISALKQDFKLSFPAGHNPQTQAVADSFIREFGREKLGLVAKLDMSKH